MKRLILIMTLFSSLAYFGACQTAVENSDGSSIKETLSVDQFNKKLQEDTNAQLVDVRTTEEYAEGHLKGAVNINVNAEDYKEQFGKLDKSKPVFVYCLSGGRSGYASKVMQKMGFREVYNMDGGIIKWTSAGMPIEQGNSTSSTAMSVDDLNKMVNKPNYVLVDYHAKWCEPCQKLAPVVESFSDKRKEKLTLLKIDYDENKTLLQQKNISSIPYLELYKDGKLIWSHEGYMDEDELAKETKL